MNRLQVPGRYTVAVARAVRPWALGPLLCLAASGAYGWSEHASLLWPLVREIPALRESVIPAEPLRDFVTAEASGLEALLEAQEKEARERFEFHAPLPEGLAFRAGGGDPVHAFLTAIRVNPTLAYGLYRQVMVDDDLPPDDRLLRFADLSFLTPDIAHRGISYHGLRSGESVSPAQVLASASEEPDFGIDIGLFTDNGTAFGKRYGFGTQPFGNPNLEYGSQAPFHMGFYHLDWLTRTAQPALLHSYPEWRIHLFGALADFAFATGHDYWGWRFAGWALHYIGDLTQPYHAQPLPGVSTPRALWLVMRGKSAEAVQLVSNRHGVIESYQYQRLRDALARGDWNQPLLRAIAAGGPPVAYSDLTLRHDLTRESVAAAAALDAALEAQVPARFVSDPDFEWIGSDEESTITTLVKREGGSAALAALDRVLIVQLQRFSRYARAWIDRMQERAGAP